MSYIFLYLVIFLNKYFKLCPCKNWENYVHETTNFLVQQFNQEYYSKVSVTILRKKTISNINVRYK